MRRSFDSKFNARVGIEAIKEKLGIKNFFNIEINETETFPCYTF